MATSDLLIIDRGSRRRGQGVEHRALVAACHDLRRRRGWWAGILEGASPDGTRAGLRRGDVALVVRDPQGRHVAWLGRGRRDDAESEGLATVAEHLVAGCGVLWVEPAPPARRLARAWRVLGRAHARALLGRAAGLPEALCRRLSGDDPAAVRRAIRAWLTGDETLAVDLVYSALAERIARGEPGYGDRGAPPSTS